MYTIRQAHFLDTDSIYNICLKTGNNGRDASDLYIYPHLLGDYYAANYMTFENDACFVITEDEETKESTAQGYILGCTNSKRFNEWMETTWLPPLRKKYILTSGKSETENTLIRTLHEDHNTPILPQLQKYPAHLHIDILPHLQGKGLGAKLIKTFEAYLQKKNIAGVHLGVSGENKSAIGFYQKQGFEIIDEKDWGLLMGKILL